MDINWYGLSCFRIRERKTTIVCDPFDKSTGLLMPRLKADIVTISHDRAGHNAIGRISGDPKVLTGPGEYESRNVFVTGSTTYHRTEEGMPPERNVVFFFDFNGYTIGHLGDLGEVPSKSEIDDLNLGEVDVLMAPVGGGATLDPARAVEVIGMLEPKIIIPMHYRHPSITTPWALDLEPVDRFLKELGVTVPEPIGVLKLTKSSLPDETQVVLLDVTQ